jgi:hypothetical protein
MSEKLDLRPEEITFFEVDGEPMLSEDLQDKVDVELVVGVGPGMDVQVVDVLAKIILRLRSKHVTQSSDECATTCSHSTKRIGRSFITTGW